MMITSLKLKFGNGPSAAAEDLEPTPVTVFVGPNNSGKSKLLSEIHQFCSNGQKNVANVILEELIFRGFDEASAIELVSRLTLAPQRNEVLGPENVIFGKGRFRQQLNRANLINILRNPQSHVTQFCSWFISFNTLMLDGKTRMNLASDQAGGDLKAPPQSSFQLLFQDNAKRAEVRRIIHDAFGDFLVIDPTNLGHLALGLSKTKPVSDLEERGIHEDAVRFHSKTLPVAHASDGVKAFAGMIAEIVAGDPSVILIDEPEAFLHPSLAYKLGKEIALTAQESGKQIFASTHSANFVMGCVQSNAPVNIIRLTYRNGAATSRILRNDDLLKLMRNPLLRSTNVIGAIFYEFVVVTESDTDRAFYQEINDRLVQSRSGGGIPNCLFLNAQNKQTVSTILRPLRELGIPAAAVVDIDILKEGGTVWTSFLGSGYVPVPEHQPLGAIRHRLNEELKLTAKDMKKDGGISLLHGDPKETAQNLIQKLAEYGLFVVDRGELESGMPELGIPGKGPAWLIAMFQRMGDDPESSDYVRPTGGDVWAFVDSMRPWMTNAQRKGIPS